MARSGHSTQLTSRRHRTHQPQSQKLTENEISELKNYLPEWTSAKRSEKRGVFNAIAQAARLFAPKVDQGQWKKRKQMYETWLFNNKKKKERKDMIKYGRKWTPRQVIYQQNREEVLKRIEDKFGAKPGGQDMFKHYQAVVKKVMADLSEDELEKAKETTEEWSNNFPPPETQAQVAHKKGPTMWDESFMKTKDWEDIEPVWQEYAQGTVQEGEKRMKKPVFDLELDGDGMPLLPDITETKLEEKKAIVRAFLTKHYRICSGIDKAVVPWSAIIQSQDDFVARQYLPEDENLKEPSKLQNWDTTALLNFWYARQKMGEGPMFLFKAWRNKEGDMVDSVVSEKSPPRLKLSTASPEELLGKKDAIEAPARTTRKLLEQGAKSNVHVPLSHMSLSMLFNWYSISAPPPTPSPASAPIASSSARVPHAALDVPMPDLHSMARSSMRAFDAKPWNPIPHFPFPPLQAIATSLLLDQSVTGTTSPSQSALPPLIDISIAVEPTPSKIEDPSAIEGLSFELSQVQPARDPSPTPPTAGAILVPDDPCNLVLEYNSGDEMDVENEIIEFQVTNTDVRVTYIDIRVTSIDVRATDIKFRASSTKFWVTNTDIRVTDIDIRVTDIEFWGCRKLDK
ncbi:uncharacterized protein EDB91DRAFT_1089472 [Suillus paluster]|uniref:uncharacterized protein n=1 Tax=Suillus paluster TaxID=48578 RepID=UPI001B874D08|nr:uncharacterized protein EDB91DRAFT_1089472 [Suillus paluster]KAG1719202.1 hypothetical protein EDB91DRAFT_1089472 [Suillus paluster]